jgi:hypothetical protein
MLDSATDRGDAGCRCPCAVLEAAHVWGGDGCYAGVGLVVFGLADGEPFGGFVGAVDDEFGEAV